MLIVRQRTYALILTLRNGLMFTNVLYFLSALVIYTTSELFEPVKIHAFPTLLKTALISSIFVVICKIAFNRLADKIKKEPFINIDHEVGLIINRLSILSLMVFSVNIYGFKLYALFSGVWFFTRIPTIEAVLFVSVFLFYLVVIWSHAYSIQKKLFAAPLSRKQFILSNAAFSLPAMLPWFVISIVSDLLGLLPWQPLKTVLESPAGEMGYILFFLAAIAVFGPVLIKKIWQCKPLEKGPARTRIEYVCSSAGISYSDILIWDLFGGAMITAGVMGLWGRFRYILVTPALLNSLDPNELDAVMLHEIGHVQKHHMLFYMLFFVGFTACNFVFFEPILFLLYLMEPVYHILEMAGIHKATAHPVLFSLLLILFFLVYFRFVFGLFMRNFERQADLHLYAFVPDASALISTFYKIAAHSRQAMEKPNWHHFSIGQRVRFLERCQNKPELINAHHSKVKKMMIAYLVVIALVFSIGYSISYGGSKEGFEQFIAKKILFQELAVDPENADLYVLVGDYYYNEKLYQKAIDAYENVLKVAPDNIHALNNLAWLYTTCPDGRFRDYSSALVFAQKAVTIQKEDFILDTYAEALFVNNDVENALAAARQALEIAKGKKEYYLGQVERFEKERQKIRN